MTAERIKEIISKRIDEAFEEKRTIEEYIRKLSLDELNEWDEDLIRVFGKIDALKGLLAEINEEENKEGARFLRFALAVLNRWSYITTIDIDMILGCVNEDKLIEFGKEVAEMFCKSFIMGVDEDD